MRSVLIPNTDIKIAWRDERKGRVTIPDATTFSALLRHYKLCAEAITLPLSISNNDFSLTCLSDEYPCTVVIFRKPQGPVQTAAWDWVEETRMGRIELQEEKLGMRFLDEDVWVAFEQLDYDPKQGFRIL